MFTEKLKVVGQTLFTLFILLSVGFLSALTAIRFAIRGQVVSVPALVGLNTAQGEKELAARKLLLKIETKVYNDVSSEGMIVSQEPPVGAQVKTRSRVSVVLSLGRRKVPIPELTDETMRAAQINLARRGLTMGLVAAITDSAVAKDHIVAQEPPADSREALSPTVNLLLSRGPGNEAYLVPDFIGMELRRATEIVDQEGFKRGAVNTQPYPGVASGVVIVQDPPSGSKVYLGSLISFTVSK